MLNYKSDFTDFGLLSNSPIKIDYNNTQVIIKVPTIVEQKRNDNIIKALSFVTTEIDEFNSHAEKSGIKADSLIDYINGILYLQSNEYTEALKDFFSIYINNCTVTKQGLAANDVLIDYKLMEDLRYYWVVGCGVANVFEANKYHSYALSLASDGELTETEKLKRKIMKKQAQNRQKINKIKSKQKKDGNNSVESLVFLLAFRIKFYSFDELLNKNMFTINWMSDLIAESQGQKKKSSNPFEHLKR